MERLPHILYQDAFETLKRQRSGKDLNKPQSVDAVLSALAAHKIEAKLTENGKTIYATSYEHRNFLKQLGFRWDGKMKSWYLTAQ